MSVADMTHVGFLKTLARERDPQQLQHKLLMLLLNLQNVERGSIWIRRGDSYQCIEAAGAESETVKGIRLPVKQKSIVGWVIENGQMTISEPATDHRHYHEIENELDVKSQLILCYPLFLSTGKVYGAVQIIDTSAGGDQLNLKKEHLALLQDLVDIGAIALDNSLAYSTQLERARMLEETIQEMNLEGVLVGVSDAFQRAVRLVENYAATDYPVLIYGESGTGKELLAREIHHRSARRDGPMLAQNCSAIPDNLLESELFGYEKGAFTGAERRKIGLFEAAEGGTIFLDEIGEMESHLQAKLLRVLQENEIKPLGGTQVKSINVRIISATNMDLLRAIREGRFREDLYYRLNVLPLSMPPLRDRPDDIPFLADHFLKREAKRFNETPKKLTQKALEQLMHYPWPGNVRELENFIKQLMALSLRHVVGLEDLPPHFKMNYSPGERPLSQAMEDPSALRHPKSAPSDALHLTGLTWEDVEKSYALFLLEKFEGNITRAAKVANLNRSTFDSRLARLGIKKRFSAK
jgi:transcriptional regulator with GAF, ATPase, and Fis domain